MQKNYTITNIYPFVSLSVSYQTSSLNFQPSTLYLPGVLPGKSQNAVSQHYCNTISLLYYSFHTIIVRNQTFFRPVFLTNSDFFGHCQKRNTFFRLWSPDFGLKNQTSLCAVQYTRQKTVSCNTPDLCTLLLTFKFFILK